MEKIILATTNKMKPFCLTILITLIFGLQMPCLALAEDPAPASTTPATTETTTTTPAADENASDDGFKVSEILTVPNDKGEDSKTSIFDSLMKTVKDSNGSIDSPIVAGIMRIIDIMLLLIGTFAFVMLFIGGIIMLTSTEENGIERAKTLITQSLIGLVLAFMSYFIVTFVQSFFY